MSDRKEESKSDLPAVAAGTAAVLGGAYGGKKLIDHAVKARRIKGLKILGGIGLGYTGLAAGIAALRKHTDKRVLDSMMHGIRIGGGVANSAHTSAADKVTRNVLSLAGKKVHNTSGRGISKAERSSSNAEVLRKFELGHGDAKIHQNKPAKVLDFEAARKKRMEKLSSILSNGSSFWSGFEKRASGWSTAAELGGLGVLAVPSIQKLRGHPMDEDTAAKMEILGLGTLAAPYLGSMARTGAGKAWDKLGPKVVPKAEKGLKGFFKKHIQPHMKG